MDRDRIASLLDTFEKSNRSVTLSNDQARELFRLALAHLDSTRARRVGEAVIASMSAEGLTPDDLTNFDSFDDRDGYPVEVPHFDLSDLLRAIAAALRGEP